MFQGVADDFADLPDLAQGLRVLVRLIVAAVLGGMVGLERGRRGKSAGMRTHMLVSMGAALFVLVPQQAGLANADISRVIQGLVAGVGFLGAGAILHNREEGRSHGLTTAAGIWLTAAIGMAAGMGRAGSAVLSTVLTLVILAMLQPLERKLEWLGPLYGGPRPPRPPA